VTASRRRSRSQLRYAPSFIPGGSFEDGGRAYSADTIGRFLGWLDPDGSPKSRIYDALAELEAQELELVSAADMRRMDRSEEATKGDIKTVVKTARRVFQTEKRKTGDEKRAKAKAREVAHRLADPGNDLDEAVVIASGPGRRSARSRRPTAAARAPPRCRPSSTASRWRSSLPATPGTPRGHASHHYVPPPIVICRTIVRVTFPPVPGCCSWP
jgi:hypothetical protein